MGSYVPTRDCKPFRIEGAEKRQFLAKGSFPVDIQQHALSNTRNLIKCGIRAIKAIMAGYPTLSVIGMKAPIKAFNSTRAPIIAGDADDNFCLGSDDVVFYNTFFKIITVVFLFYIFFATSYEISRLKKSILFFFFVK